MESSSNASASTQSKSWVKLNVGGQVYQKITLIPILKFNIEL